MTTYVNANTNAFAGTGTVTYTIPFAQTAGDCFLFVVNLYNSSTFSAPTSVHDTAGNTYNAPIQTLGNTNEPTTCFLYAVSNIKAAAANANTVTMTLPSGAQFPQAFIIEYTGASITSLVNASNGVGTPTTSPISTPITTTISNCELVGIITGNGGDGDPLAIGSGFTSRYNSGDGWFVAGDASAATATSYTFDPTSGSPGFTTTFVVALEPGSGPTIHSDPIFFSMDF